MNFLRKKLKLHKDSALSLRLLCVQLPPLSHDAIPNAAAATVARRLTRAGNLSVPPSAGHPATFRQNAKSLPYLGGIWQARKFPVLLPTERYCYPVEAPSRTYACSCGVASAITPRHGASEGLGVEGKAVRTSDIRHKTSVIRARTREGAHAMPPRGDASGDLGVQATSSTTCRHK